MEPLIYLILLNYNGAEMTIECIESLKEIDYTNYKIIVVDNASRDNSVDTLKNIKGIDLICSNENKGFAAGNNLGIERALEDNADYVLLINNDTLVEKDFLTKLVGTAETYKGKGLVTGKIFHYPDKDKIWYAGGKMDWFKFYPIHYQDNRIEEVTEIDFASGCLMLISKEILNSVGKLPEEYFMYFEDVDYCVNILDKGFKIVYEPKAIIYHKVSAASGGEESPLNLTYGTINRRRIMYKYRKRVNSINYIFSIIFFYTTRIIKLINFKIKNDTKRYEALKNAIKSLNGKK